MGGMSCSIDGDYSLQLHKNVLFPKGNYELSFVFNLIHDNVHDGAAYLPGILLPTHNAATAIDLVLLP